MEKVIKDKIEDAKEEKTKITKPSYKYQDCKVIDYNSTNKTLDVLFKGYGIRLENIENFIGDIAKIKYLSEIGKSDFTYGLSK